MIEILSKLNNLIAKEVYIEKITKDYNLNKELIINQLKGDI